MQKGFSEDAMTRENRKQFRKDIETYVRRHGELVLLLLALLMGAAGTCLYGIYAQEPEPVRVEQTAWWGGLYPEYCMPGAGDKAVRIRFRYLTFFNKEPEAYIGETDE